MQAATDSVPEHVSPSATSSAPSTARAMTFRETQRSRSAPRHIPQSAGARSNLNLPPARTGVSTPLVTPLTRLEATRTASCRRVGRRERAAADDSLACEACPLEHTLGCRVPDVHVGRYPRDAERECVLGEQPRDRRRDATPTRVREHEVADLDDARSASRWCSVPPPRPRLSRCRAPRARATVPSPRAPASRRAMPRAPRDRKQADSRPRGLRVGERGQDRVDIIEPGKPKNTPPRGSLRAAPTGACSAPTAPRAHSKV